MTRLNNPNFINFDGEPITGRVPPRIRIYGQASKEQLGMLSHEYKLFCDALHTMVGKYLARDRVLADGSRIRMTSNIGLDSVEFWPVGGEDKSLDPSGYLTTPIETKQGGKTQGWKLSATNDPISPDAHVKVGYEWPPSITLHSKYQAGAVNWLCPSGYVLSYNHDGTNRYSTNLWDTALGASVINLNAKQPQTNVYYRGTTIVTSFKVLSAAIYQGWLVCIGHTTGNFPEHGVGTLYYCPSPIRRIDEELKKGNFVRKITPTFRTAVVTITSPQLQTRRCSAWHFKPDGSRAACAIVNAVYSIPNLPTVEGSGRVPPFNHTNTWYMKRALTEALPQAKRYLNLSTTLVGDDLQLIATVEDTTFATEALGARFVVGGAPIMAHDYLSRGTWPEGGELSYAAAANPTGEVTYTGKRLWGVDYDEQGNELLLTMRITGSGNALSTSSYSMDMKWDLRINDVVLFEVPTDAASTGPFETHHVTVHSLDMRHKAAIIERLVRTATGPNILGTAQLTMEHYFDNALVFSDVVSMPTEGVQTCRAAARWSDLSNWTTGSWIAQAESPGYALQCGPIWVVSNSWGHGGFGMNTSCFPQIQGGTNGENASDYRVWSEIDSYINAWDPGYAPGTYQSGPQQYVQYARYPNQVSETIFASWVSTYAYRPDTWAPIFRFKSNTGSFNTYIDAGFLTQLYRIVMGDTFFSFNSSGEFPFVQTIAKKNREIDNYGIATVNAGSWAVNRFLCSVALNPPLNIDGLTMDNLTLYSANSIQAMTTTCSIFIRPKLDPSDPEAPRPFTRYSLEIPMEAKINLESPFVDTPSFRIDPIRVI